MKIKGSSYAHFVAECVVPYMGRFRSTVKAATQI